MHGVLDEIDADLKSNIGIVRYIPLNDRERLVKIFEGCAGVCAMVSKSDGKSSECIAILNLSSSNAPCIQSQRKWAWLRRQNRSRVLGIVPQWTHGYA